MRRALSFSAKDVAVDTSTHQSNQLVIGELSKVSCCHPYFWDLSKLPSPTSITQPPSPYFPSRLRRCLRLRRRSQPWSVGSECIGCEKRSISAHVHLSSLEMLNDACKKSLFEENSEAYPIGCTCWHTKTASDMCWVPGCGSRLTEATDVDKQLSSVQGFQMGPGSIYVFCCFFNPIFRHTKTIKNI